MADDRSLDDFAAPDETDADSDAANDGGADGDSSPARSDDADGVEPAVATSTWHADGAACDRCGERAERRWRDGDALVCADCASW
ncbi:NADH pyrophosphatase NudC (nudix superfamily) [Halorubrum trapanicum]|uniref:NADH pyrophosphatase NudC (Nudix superfamily) n=1 Tax=Halorubrum trapanicum TaxID=29284 RepID=A0A8J7RCJ3_9EURY|nr:hypothetical protein [Halorubrum trapanicum]MBP1901498.1 NADH pyrophosphatase NudC (nudix superfamily) [Halorubrum trapanicum]